MFCTSLIYSVLVQKQIVPKCKLNYNMYTVLCIQAMSVKGSEASHILPMCCLSFPVSLFSSFLSLGKRYQITEVRSHIH